MSVCTDASSSEEASALRAKCLQTLRDGLQNGTRWVKVHAAEYLISLGYSKDAAAAFERELASYASEPQYRIGIWRVLAQAAGSGKGRAQWVDRIREVALESASPDQGNALESLGKLGYRVRSREEEGFSQALQSVDPEISALARWVMANAGGKTEEREWVALLTNDSPRMRGLTAYALTYSSHLRAASVEQLMAAADREPADSSARVFLLSAAVTHARAGRQQAFKTALLQYASAGTPRQRCEVCAGLAKCGKREDVPLLRQLLEDVEQDVRVAAANALLHLARRTK